MSDFQTNTPPPPRSLTSDVAPATLMQAIIDRLGMSMLVFSGVMFGLLLVSSITVLPAFTALHRGDGISLSPRAIVEYQKKLAADLAAAEETRVKLVLPITDVTYIELTKQKHASLTLTELQTELKQAAGRLGEESDVVVLSTIVIDHDHVTVTGDVRGVGTRSMTVLGAFVEEVMELAFVTDLKRPPFTREALPDGSFHSPFTMSFTISQ